MKKSSRWTHWIGWRIVGVVLCAFQASCANLATPLPANPPEALSALQQQVDSQATRIAALELQAQAPEEERIAALETQVAIAQTLLATSTPEPVPTIVPAVAGLVMKDNTKGSADAKVTITEYVDYF